MKSHRWEHRGESEKGGRQEVPNRTLGSELAGKGFFRSIIEHSADALLVIDREGVVQFLNPAASRLFGRPSKQMIGQIFGFPVDTDGPQEVDILRPGGDSRVAEMRVAQMELEGERFYVASLRDITELVRLREGLRSLLLIDELTGLNNRRGFFTLAQQQMKLARRHKRGMVLLFIDLDHLKWINDTFGHLEGDRALIETAQILRATFRESDIIARIGGDEFVVLALETSGANAEVLKSRLEQNLAAHNARRNRRYELSFSVGVAHYDPKHPCSIEELIAQADQHMYTRKKGGVESPQFCV